MESVRDIGEVEAIRRLTRGLPSRDDVILGIGDDCAVVRPAPDSATDWLLTSDPVIESVHFLPDADPRAVGHKAVARALSDIAAMGGTPAWALINVVAPPNTPIARLESLYAGASTCATTYGLAIVGGDVAEGPRLELHVFATGTVPAGTAIARSGAKAGDRLFVTGALGGSRRGKHLSFEPRLGQGAWLRDWATSAIDLSDGLAADLRHLMQMSGLAAELDLREVPVSDDARLLDDGTPPLEHALCDGEDFELLFTIPATREADFRTAWAQAFDLPCTAIGHMRDEGSELTTIGMDGRHGPLSSRGFAHWTQVSPVASPRGEP